MQIAVLGTGVMGAGMARSLLREGFDVRVWNRSPTKATPLEHDGATVAATARDAARDAARGADAVVTMLKEPAEQGQPVPIVSGEEEVVERVRPFLEAVGVKTVYAGGELGQDMAAVRTAFEPAPTTPDLPTRS